MPTINCWTFIEEELKYDLTFRTLADIRADDILARMRTHFVVLSALVDVLAVHAVGRDRVPVRTRAAERTRRVVAAERAHRAAFRTLVYVHTCL